MICCHGFLKYQILSRPVESGRFMAMGHTSLMPAHATTHLTALCTYAGLCMKDA